MATLPIDEFVSVREYLNTSYSPDCEYVDGRVEERNLGEKDHARIQIFLAFLFLLHRDDWGVEAFTEFRTQVAGTRFRVPDVLVVRSGEPLGDVLDRPPLIAIEILSPRDSLSGMRGKFEEYLAFGVEHIWVFDPGRREAWWVDGHGLHLVSDGELRADGTAIRVGLSEVFGELDRG